MSPEQEAFAPEGATFTPTGEVFGVRAGRDIIPGRTFRRGQGGEAPDDVISGQQLAEESTEARRDISSSAKRAEQSGEPFSRGMAGELFSRGMGSIDPSAPGPTGSIIPGADSSSTPPSTPPTAPPSGPSIFGIEDLSVPGTPPSTPPTAPPSGPTIPGIEDFSVPGPPTDPPSEPPTGPPSEPPIAPPSWPPTGPPSKPPTAPPSEPPTGPPSVPPSMPPSSPPPSSPPPSSPPPSIPGLPQAGGPPSPFGEFSLPSRSEDEDRETPIPAGQEFQNPIASGAQFLFGGFGGQVPSGGDATEDIIGLFGGERSGG